MMEELENKSKIGEAFSKGFENFTIEPKPQVWGQIVKKIPTKASPTISKNWITPIAIVAFAVVLIGIYLINDQKNQSLAVNTKIQTVKTNTISVPESQKSQLIIDNQPVADKISDKDKQNTILIDICNDPIPIKEVEAVSKKDPNLSKNQQNTLINPQILQPSHISTIHQIEDNLNQTEFVKGEIYIDTTILYSSVPIICFGETAKLSVTGGEYFQWSNGSSSSYINVEPVNNSSYSVVVTDKYNFQHKHEFKVIIDRECSTVFLPSAFTPNADGNNDIFKAEGENIQEFSIQIMNREGRILFTGNTINQGWDGTYKGSPQPSQVYVYTVVYKNGRGVQNIVKGQFTLIR